MRKGYRVNCLGQGAFRVFGFATAVPTSSAPTKAKSAIWKAPRKPVRPWVRYRYRRGGAIPDLPEATVPSGLVKLKATMSAPTIMRGDNGDDFNDGEPEFDFTEVLHRGQVQQQQSHDNGQRRDKAGISGHQYLM